MDPQRRLERSIRATAEDGRAYTVLVYRIIPSDPSFAGAGRAPTFEYEVGGRAARQISIGCYVIEETGLILNSDDDDLPLPST
jgi:hypothetical protein